MIMRRCSAVSPSMMRFMPGPIWPAVRLMIGRRSSAHEQRSGELWRGPEGLDAHRSPVVRRAGRPDRADASRAGGRAEMALRETVPARAQLLHADAWPRGHAACDLCGLAHAWPWR